MRYRTICADPPWPYGDAGVRGGTSKKYASMSIADICALPVAELAETNAHLYLWTTNSFMSEALLVMEAWGFDFKTIVTWVKADPRTGTTRIGAGHYFRGTTEHMLFGVRGKLPPAARNLPTHFLAPRLEHSQKPDEAFAIAEKMSPYHRLEMFARGAGHKNWDRWGDQADAGPGLILMPSR